MEQTIGKIIKTMSQAFDIGSKAIQDMYPIIRQEWMVYKISEIFIIGCSILLTAGVVKS